jgi:Ca2+/Na+ antiporter
MSFVRPTNFGEISYEEPKKARDAAIVGTVALILAIIFGKIYGGINATVSIAALVAFGAFTFAWLHGFKIKLTSNSKQRRKLYFTLFFILCLVFGFMADQIGLQFIGIVGILFLWGKIIYRQVKKRVFKQKTKKEDEDEKIENQRQSGFDLATNQWVD